MKQRFIDISHTVEPDMITYRGLPGPKIDAFMEREASATHYAPGVTFHIGRVDMVANTGTYLDAPFHRFAAGKDLADVPLEWIAGLDLVVVRAKHRADRAIDVDAFESVDVSERAVVVHTGWDIHWGTDRYFVNYPFLTGNAASFLVEQGALLVGIDSVNVDDDSDGARPVHSTLLEAEVPVLEHLCHLNGLPDTGAALFAVPPKMRGLGSFPVRAFAMLTTDRGAPEGEA